MLLNKEDSVLLLVDVQEKLAPAVWNYDAFIARCEWLLKLAQRMDVPVLVSEQYPKGLGPTVEQLRTYFDQEQCIEKVHFSCMQQPDYARRLRELNKNQLIVIGIEAHVCVLQTAMEMKSLGFDVYVVADAVSSRNNNDCKYALKRMKQEGIQLITAEMIFFEWLRHAGTPEFKALSKEFLQ
ncbi:hydrolase [Legionella fallonii]|uniref:YcaC like amidohydrolase n=1 Tax=Legionella fallonii LLAP-10 TaxID=1212491 RepID=A0A098G4K8_9GAMM|nr:hydrolase [Legionella fallonii]CEG56415.1 YcaC like amidohydrolase [Legionella fallonii LLAP-10]